MIGDFSDLPLVVLIAFLCALGWHFAYMFAFIGSAVQEMTGIHRNFKRWDVKVEAAQKRVNENPGDLGAIQDFLESLEYEGEERDERPLMEELRRELWWIEVHLAYPLMNICWLLTANHWWDIFTSAVNIWLNYDWWKNHDHDDRWKKRRKKALAKVKAVGGKLVVVPVPAPAH